LGKIEQFCFSFGARGKIPCGVLLSGFTLPAVFVGAWTTKTYHRAADKWRKNTQFFIEGMFLLFKLSERFPPFPFFYGVFCHISILK
jgi:hypothetical protein